MYLSFEIKGISVDPQALEPTIVIAVQFGGPQISTIRFLSLACDIKAAVGDKSLNLGIQVPSQIQISTSIAYVTIPVELGHFKVNAIEKHRTKDVVFRVFVQGNCAIASAPAVNVLKFEQLEYTQAESKIAASDWVDWLKLWGKDLNEITVSGSTMAQIEKIPELSKKDWSETVSTLLSEYVQLRHTIEQLRKGASIEFVYTELESRTIKEKMASMIERLSKDDTLLITGYVGSPFLDKILQALNRGSKIRIITRSLKDADKETQESTRRIFKQSPDGVRQNTTIHARLFAIEGKEAIISSADTKSDSIDTNYEAGVWTDNPLVISDLSKFFDRAWEQSKPLQA